MPVEYIARNGPDISTTFECDDGTRLGHWVSSQRASRQTGSLSAERVARLDDLGFVWQVRDEEDDEWLRGIGLLTRYVEEHGDSRVPGDHVAPDGTALGAWVARRRWEHRHGLLRAERVGELAALGFEWTVTPQPGMTRATDDRAFRAWVDALQTYRDESGHCRVPAGFATPDGRRLGDWVAYTRARHAKGLLAQDRVEVLDRLGFEWRVRDNEALWQQGVEALRAYVVEHGHARVPIRYWRDDGFRLGQWVRSRRSEGKGGRLSPERTAALDALGFVWDPTAPAT